MPWRSEEERLAERIRKDAQAQEAAARHVLGYYNLPGGYQPGGFTAGLISLWEKADPVNRAKLCMAFPEMGYVIEQFQKEGGEEIVRQIAERRIL